MNDPKTVLLVVILGLLALIVLGMITGWIMVAMPALKRGIQNAVLFLGWWVPFCFGMLCAALATAAIDYHDYRPIGRAEAVIGAIAAAAAALVWSIDLRKLRRQHRQEVSA